MNDTTPIAQPKKRAPWLIPAAIVGGLSPIVIGLLFLGVAALTSGNTVCIHNGERRAVKVEVDGKALENIAPGETDDETFAPGRHHLIARSGKHVVQEGDFDVPEKSDPVLGFTGVYLIGKPRLVLVDHCYGSCRKNDERAIDFDPHGQFFVMPGAVYARTLLDEEFPERSHVDGLSSIRTHLCTVDAQGTPRCIE